MASNVILGAIFVSEYKKASLFLGNMEKVL